MENVLITMNDNGDLRCSDPNGGYIEEMKARQLVISVNSFFRSSVISYFTISFEPYGLGKKIVTDNIYKGENSGEVSYSSENGTITCPIFDYISVSPKVSIQIDGYETDENSDVCAIYKSGIMSLHFSESLVGEKIIPDFTNAEMKLSERISHLIEDELASAVFETQNIEDNAVTNAKIEDGGVTSEKLADNSVVESKINDGAVTADKIAVGSITGSKIAQGTILATNIADNAIKTSKINPSAVTNEKLATGAVTSGKIGSGEVMANNIADSAVKTSKINDGAVTAEKIASGAVISSKVAAGAIGSSNIANAAVTAEKICNQAVTTDKITSGAVTSSKIAQETILASNIADNAIKTSKINPSAVTNEKIASGAVTSGKIYSGEDNSQKIQGGNIGNSAIKEANINPNAVTTEKIANGAVTKAKLASDVKTAFDNTTAYNILNDARVNFISYSHTNSSPYTINTEAEYIYNCKQGYTSIKGDMRLTSDGKIIMCHDAGFTFDGNGKITTYDSNNCTLIHDLTYAECMAKQYVDGSSVCDFETYIGICKKHGKIAAFDLRYEYIDDTLTEMFIILDKYRMRGNCLVACDRAASANALRAVDSNIMMGFTGGRSDDVTLREDGRAQVRAMIDNAKGWGNCIYFGFDFPFGSTDYNGNNRNGVSALDVTFDDGDGNQVTAVEYARNNGVRFYECVVEHNTENNVNIIEECVNRGVVGFTTEDVVPDFAKKSLTEFVSDSTHRTVTDAEKTAWNGKENTSNKVNSFRNLTIEDFDTKYPTCGAVISEYSGYIMEVERLKIIAESTFNKVTSIDTSNPSATEYPSESAVVSYVSGIIGDIDSLLDTINGEVI